MYLYIKCTHPHFHYPHMTILTFFIIFIIFLNSKEQSFTPVYQWIDTLHTQYSLFGNIFNHTRAQRVESSHDTRWNLEKTHPQSHVVSTAEKKSVFISSINELLWINRSNYPNFSLITSPPSPQMCIVNFIINTKCNVFVHFSSQLR